MIADLHLHTRLSSDAEQYEENNVQGFVDAAENAGLQYIAITEHRDIYETPECINADLDECARQIAAAKKRILENTDSKVSLLHGVELAHAYVMKKEAAEIVGRHDYDFILGSLHKLKYTHDFYAQDYKSLSDAELLKMFDDYLSELYDIASNADFDSFAHCIYPLRYYARNGRLPDLCAQPSEYVPKNAPGFADIFVKLIERNKALEVNTSGIKVNEFTLPTADLIKLYFDLGGRLVTVGSDSHDKKFIGSGVDVAEKMLKEIGFHGVTVFVGRQPKVVEF